MLTLSADLKYKFRQLFSGIGIANRENTSPLGSFNMNFLNHQTPAPHTTSTDLSQIFRSQKASALLLSEDDPTSQQTTVARPTTLNKKKNFQ